MEQTQNTATAAKTEEKSMDVRFTGGIVDELIAMAARDQRQMAELIADALRNEHFLQSVRLSGKRLYVQEPNGVMIPVTFGRAPTAAPVAAKPAPVAKPVAAPVAATASAPVAPKAPVSTSAATAVAKPTSSTPATAVAAKGI